MANITDVIGAYCQGLPTPVLPTPLKDYAVADAGAVGVGKIIFWNVATLGPQPSAAQLAAITPAQVLAYRKAVQAAAATALLADPSGPITLLRALMLAAGLTTAQLKAQIQNATEG